MGNKLNSGINTIVAQAKDAEDRAKGISAKQNEEINKTLASIGSEFNSFLPKKIDYGNNQSSQVNPIFNKLSTNILFDVSNLLQDIDNENVLIQNQITLNNSLINESGFVEWQYKKPEVEKLTYQNYVLYFIFYVLLIILASIMFYMNNTSFIFQTVVFHVLLVYPFVIYYLELLLFIIYKYLYSYLFGVPYDSVYIGYY